MKVRSATLDDLPAIAAIYAVHVREGTGSFEERPPSPEALRSRFESVREAGLPWVVAADGDGIAGYAYAAPWKTRAAYRFTVEGSIYVAAGRTGQGIGSTLLKRLIEHCAANGYRTMMAVAGDGENTGSVALHRRHGFRVIGTAHGIGFKFGRWLDVVYLQRSLDGESISTPGSASRG